MVNWSSGNIPDNTVFTVATNGVLRISGSAMKYLTGTGTLINYGSITWSGSNDIQTLNFARIINQAGALFDIQNNQSLLIWNGGAITNLGTLRKSAGGGSTVINVPFNNTGTVDVQVGTITFGNHTQTGGKLSFGLNSPTNFGRLAIANNIAFSGTLGANLNGGYMPVAGDAFAVITYPSRTGTFAGFDLPTTHAWQTNGSIYGATAVTLTVLNSRPNFTPIADQTTDEQVLLSLSVTGSDPDAGQSLTYVLLDPPGGATIHGNTGLFSWTPGEAQGPATNVIAVQITDNGAPSLSATQQFTVVVNEVNLAPTIVVPATQTFDEMTTLTAPHSTTDPDIPANSFHYTLVSGPSGVSVDTNSGVLTWTPTEAQGPSSNTITVAVIDDGTPSLSNTNSFTVIVREVNSAPVLTPLADCTHASGTLRWITNSASDPDDPAEQLTFSLLNAPPGMSIGPASGLMIWGPPANCETLTNTVTVRVTDGGSPALTNEQSFVATLIPIPRLRIAQAGSGSVVLSWPAAATDAGFALQSCTNFVPVAGWQRVPGAPTVIGGENLLTESETSPFSAYRLASALTPLPTLQIAATTSNAVVVYWPVTATAAGFVLQTAADFQSPTAWTSVTNPVGTTGSLNCITDSMNNAHRCYRLELVGPP